jgi:hypothetical protein
VNPCDGLGARNFPLLKMKQAKTTAIIRTVTATTMPTMSPVSERDDEDRSESLDVDVGDVDVVVGLTMFTAMVVKGTGVPWKLFVS